MVFPFTPPFVEPSLLLCSFLFSSPAPVLAWVPVSGLPASAFQRAAIKGLPAQPGDNLENTEEEVLYLHSCFLCCAVREKRAE